MDYILGLISFATLFFVLSILKRSRLITEQRGTTAPRAPGATIDKLLAASTVQRVFWTWTHISQLGRFDKHIVSQCSYIMYMTCNEWVSREWSLSPNIQLLCLALPHQKTVLFQSKYQSIGYVPDVRKRMFILRTNGFRITSTNNAVSTMLHGVDTKRILYRDGHVCLAVRTGPRKTAKRRRGLLLIVWDSYRQLPSDEQGNTTGTLLTDLKPIIGANSPGRQSPKRLLLESRTRGLGQVYNILHKEHRRPTSRPD